MSLARAIASHSLAPWQSALKAAPLLRLAGVAHPRPISIGSIRFGPSAAVGSGYKENFTGKKVTGFSVKDSDVWQNRSHEWRTIRRYQGGVRAVSPGQGEPRGQTLARMERSGMSMRHIV